MIAECVEWVRRTLSLVVVGCMGAGMPMFAQTATVGAKAFTFDVVSIHPTNPDSQMTRVLILSDRFSANGVSMMSLISFAYPVKNSNQISGVSGSTGSARFDVEAKMDEDTAAALKKLPDEERQTQRRLMLQTMLADRFKLKVHHESKEVAVYALVIAKGGFKLKEADPKNTYANGIKGPDGVSHAGMLMVSNGRLTGQAISTQRLADNVSGQVHRIVEDKTGLAGRYDVALQWSPEDNRGTPLPGGTQQDAASATDSGPSIFTALQEQLGLKLESAREPVDAIVVDHVEMPSEN
jgi:uncharacterized protein (TIGR03435 family)